jgi:hypothetical protein
MALAKQGEGAGVNLRKEARGRDCQVRLEGICNFDPATTVLAHYRLLGYSGIGYKGHDFVFGAWCCSSCHTVLDSSKVSHTDAMKRSHAEGVMRTQVALIEENKGPRRA